MALSLTSGVGQGFLSQQLAASQSRTNSLFQQLASGNRINQAADGAAVMGMLSSMTSSIQGNNAAMGGINQGVAVTQVADAGLASVGEGLQGLRDLAVQAANGTLSASDRTTLQTQAQALQSQINGVIGNTSFNGQNLLNAGQNVNVQTGSGAADQTALTMPNLTGAMPAINLSTQAGASNAISAIDTALDSINQSRAQMGAAQSGLESSYANLQNMNIATTSAASGMQGTDYAQATAELTSSSIRQQFSVAMMAQMNNLSAQGVLGLLH
ncbi:MAG: flagellin FliC [Magnetococcales bacterium]|nr:flagellin FliC [Magnetococcales bacterium]